MPWLYERAASSYWWIGWRVNGRVHARSTKKTALKEAEKVLAEFRMLESAQHAAKLTDEFYQGLTGQTLPKITLAAAVTGWLSECEGSTSAATQRAYKDVADAFLKHIHATDEWPLLRDVSTEMIRGFLDFRRKSVTAATVNQHRRVLAVFFIRELKNGLVRSNPVLPIKRYLPGKDAVTKRRPFTVDELKLIYRKAPDDFWRFMILGGFYCGLRMGDLICLRWEAVDIKEAVLRVTPRKTAHTSGVSMEIPIAAPLLALLKKVRKAAGKVSPSAYLWPDRARQYEAQGSGNISNAFSDAVLAPCGLVVSRKDKEGRKQGRAASRDYAPVSFHCLRHSFITLLKATGGNQAVAKELAGHTSDTVSDLYTHLPRETLSIAINNLPTL